MNLLIAGLFTLAPKTDLGMVPGNPAIGKGDKSAPTTINYQAYMTHRADTTALDTVADFTFRIYDAPTGGNLLWSENQSSVPVVRGILDTRLGINTPLPPAIFYPGQTLWLEVAMGAEIFSPRKPIVSVGQAFHAQRADTASVALNIPPAPDTVLFAWHSDTAKYSLEGHHTIYSDTADYARNVPSPGNYIQNQHASAQTPGSFWIGDSATVGNPSGKYARLNSGNYAVYGWYSTVTYGYIGSADYGVYGQHDMSNYGILGYSGRGVYGHGDVSGIYGWGPFSGVYGESEMYGVYGGGSRIGVYGYVNTSDADTGVKGEATGGGSDIGVYGKGTYGVYGWYDANNYGYLASSGYGVYGHGGNGVGVYGSYDANKFGFLGSFSYGAYGQYDANNYGCLGGNGIGVSGAGSNYGVQGLGGTYGVFGTNAVYAVYGQYSATRFGYMGNANYGAYGQYDANNYGYVGGNGYGVYGKGSAYGVYGQYDANNYGYVGANGCGVYGKSSTYGVYGQYDANRFGVLGASAYGVFGQYNGSNYGYLGGNGYGVVGAATSYGVYGQGGVIGVWGYVSSADADTGVKGLAEGGGIDLGVYGSGTYGVVGQGTSVGVYATNTTNGTYGYMGSSSYGVYSFSPVNLAYYGRTANANDTIMILEGLYYGDAKFRFMTDGNAYADGSWTGGGADFAEMVRGEKGDYEPGDVLVISDEIDRAVERSSEPYSTKVIGVVSTKPGFVAGGGDEPEGDVPVAVVGIVPCKVTGEGGLIKKGDLLTTSSAPGYAMKASPVDIGGVKIYRPGTILGKAMEDFSGERGTILIYVNAK